VPWPLSWCQASAIFSAVSAASDPELQKNTWSNPSGASSAMRLASSNACGMPNWNGGA